LSSKKCGKGRIANFQKNLGSHRESWHKSISISRINIAVATRHGVPSRYPIYLNMLVNGPEMRIKPNFAIEVSPKNSPPRGRKVNATFGNANAEKTK
jgi:hypothetical protein